MSAQEPAAENVIWTGHPSQLMAFKFYFFAAILIILLAVGSGYMLFEMPNMSELWFYPALGIPVIVFAVIIKYYLVRTKHYKLTDQRMVAEWGVFNRETEEIELYRVKDWKIEKPFFLRLANRGHVLIISTDSTAPVFSLEGVTDPDHVRELLREHSEKSRDRKNVRHLETGGGGLE